MQLIGIDIGGTKICVCFGTQQGEIRISKRIATQPLHGWKEGLKATAALIRELAQSEGINLQQIGGIGISAPGPISSREGKMLSPPNLPGWENAPLVSFFEKEFGRPVIMNHDGKAAALAEYRFGGSKGTLNLVYLTCSTGMGGGAIVEGRLVQGASDTAAEVGHFILDIHGPMCPCGLRGCFEAFCGGAAIAKKIQREIREQSLSTQILQEAGGNLEQIDAKCLINAVQKQDPYALKIWDEFCLRMAQGIGTVLMNFNPAVVILGTIAVHSGALLLDPLRKLLSRFAWKENVQACRIEASQLGDRLSELSALALVCGTDIYRT
ncbi:MAG: ROK family protein [Chlamydiia bacterium]|nr:ROK family protein [Chlamydiia bacterium]